MKKTNTIPAMWELKKVERLDSINRWEISRDDQLVYSFPEHFRRQAMNVFKILKNKD